MQQITVRQAVAYDLDALTTLFDGYRQFYGQTSDLPAARTFLRARFNLRDSVVFIAHQGQLPVGFTQLYPSLSSVSMARVFVLNDLYVHPSARRIGVAARLIAAAIHHARAEGAIRLSLSTACTNTSAQALYASLGWKRDDQFLVYQYPILP